MASGTSFEQKVVYEFMPPFCHKCYDLGHFHDGCQGTKPSWNKPNSFGRPKTPKGGANGLNKVAGQSVEKPKTSTFSTPIEGMSKGKEVMVAPVEVILEDDSTLRNALATIASKKNSEFEGSHQCHGFNF